MMSEDNSKHSMWIEHVSREEHHRSTWRAKHGDFYTSSSLGQSSTLEPTHGADLAHTVGQPRRPEPAKRVLPGHTSAVAQTLAEVNHPRSSGHAYEVSQPQVNNKRTKEPMYTFKRTSSLDFAMQR